jgi:glycosyltransferase involved in cell wall biosynthesis
LEIELLNHYQFSITLRKKFLLDRDILPPIVNNSIELPSLSESPLLSVIIAHRNGRNYLLDTLGTIAMQSFRNFEVIVVDGASSDGSLEMLLKIPNLRLISEKDGGIDDAFSKGLKIARGKYITHCCVSDGYLDVDWFGNAVGALEKNKWASLVWSFPRTLGINNTLGKISYPLLHVMYPPSGVKFFEFWTKTMLPFPEGNYIVNREVMKACFPNRPSQAQKYSDLAYDPWLTVNSNFHSHGYLSLFHNSIANYGRIHGESITSQTNLDGRGQETLLNYRESVEGILKDCLNGSTSKSFIDSQGLVIVQHSMKKLAPRLRYLQFKIRVIEIFLSFLSFLGRRINRIFPMIKNSTSKTLKLLRRN